MLDDDVTLGLLSDRIDELPRWLNSIQREGSPADWNLRLGAEEQGTPVFRGLGLRGATPADGVA